MVDPLKCPLSPNVQRGWPVEESSAVTALPRTINWDPDWMSLTGATSGLGGCACDVGG